METWDNESHDRKEMKEQHREGQQDNVPQQEKQVTEDEENLAFKTLSNV